MLDDNLGILTKKINDTERQNQDMKMTIETLHNWILSQKRELDEAEATTKLT